MIPSTTGLSETAVLGSRLDHAGMNKASSGGFPRASGAFKASCHPDDRSSAPSLFASPEKVETNGRPLITMTRRIRFPINFHHLPLLPLVSDDEWLIDVRN
jgi:hypothetical protein